MIFNCKWYKDKIRPNTLYKIRNSRSIRFVEKQKNIDEEDCVNVKFVLDKGQYGMFANEFCPSFVKDAKKADLLLFVVDEANRKYSSWILDVKVSVGGEDVIRHLIEQWIESHQHKCALSNYLKEFREKETIGVVTREYQSERILAIVEKLKKDRDKNEGIRCIAGLIYQDNEAEGIAGNKTGISYMVCCITLELIMAVAVKYVIILLTSFAKKRSIIMLI